MKTVYVLTGSYAGQDSVEHDATMPVGRFAEERFTSREEALARGRALAATLGPGGTVLITTEPEDYDWVRDFGTEELVARCHRRTEEGTDGLWWSEEGERLR
jgi:hypothetical protein